MGAIADGGETIIVRNEDVIAAAGVGEAEFNVVRAKESREIETAAANVPRWPDA